MPSFKKLLSDTMIYGLSSIIGRFLNYLLVPLYTYKIAAASGGYGIITNIYAWTALLLVILTFGMETTFFYFANKYKNRADRVFSTALIAVGSVSAVFVALVFTFAGPIAAAMDYIDHPEYLTFMACVVAIDAFQALLFARLRFEGKAWKFASLKLLFIFLNIGLNLFVFLAAPQLVQSHPEWMGWYRAGYEVGYVFEINLLCTALVTVGFIPELRKMRQGFDPSLLREMLRYTWPLLLLGIVGCLNQVADKICFRVIMPGPEGEVQLGLYGACVKIAMIMAMITQAFRYAYEPFIFGGGRDGKSRETQAVVMKFFVLFTFIAFLAVVAYMDLLKHIIAPGYWQALKAVPIVMMAEIFMGIYFNLSFWYKLIEQTWWGAVFSAVGCAALLAINFVFVPRWGYMACAWGGLAGYGICMVLSYFVGQRKNPIPYDMKRIALYFLGAMIAFAAMSLITPRLGTPWALLANTLLLVLYMAAMLLPEKRLVGSIRTKLKI